MEAVPPLGSPKANPLRTTGRVRDICSLSGREEVLQKTDSNSILLFLSSDGRRVTIEGFYLVQITPSSHKRGL